MNLKLIVAISENNVIGIDNRIPWRIKEDMERFRQITSNHPVIMGRKTYDSLPQKFRPLPNRKNIIMSRNMNLERGIYVAKWVSDVEAIIKEEESYIMGGAEIYQLFLPLVNRMEITRVHGNYEGDAFFPKVNWNDWNLINQKDGTSKDGINYSFLTYDRK